MAMFDPVYVTEVLNGILSRRGLSVSLVEKDSHPVTVDQQDGKVATDCPQKQPPKMGA